MTRLLANALPAKVFPAWCVQNDLPKPEAEYRFLPPRRFRFDWCWRFSKIALEVEGGVWTRGRHTRGSGYLKDVEKYNLAAINGWIVLRCTPKDLMSPVTASFLKAAFALRAP